LKLQKGDLLLCEGGDVGRTAIWNDQMEGCYYQNHLHRLRARFTNEIDPQFALYWFWYAFEVGNVYIGRSNITTIPNLSQSKLGELQIPKPVFDEQRRIAYVLNTVQTAIEQQARMIALTRELKSALMLKLFTEGLHGEKQKETEIGLVPESWEVVRIGSLGKCVTGTTPRTSIDEYYFPPEYDFIAPADLGITRNIYDSEKKISGRGFKIIRSLPKDAVMCVCIGSSLGKVGMTWKDESATNQQINSVICNKNFNARFVYYLLLYYADYWRRFATYSTVPILNKNRFEGIEVPVTINREEQCEIADILSSADAKIEHHAQTRVLVEELFRTLLHELMTGQKRVNEIDLSGVA